MYIMLKKGLEKEQWFFSLNYLYHVLFDKSLSQFLMIASKKAWLKKIGAKENIFLIYSETNLLYHSVMSWTFIS